MIHMDTETTGAGELFTRRIEELLQRSTLPPETVISIMRAAHANPGYDTLRKIERLQSKQREQQPPV